MIKQSAILNSSSYSFVYYYQGTFLTRYILESLCLNMFLPFSYSEYLYYLTCKKFTSLIWNWDPQTLQVSAH